MMRCLGSLVTLSGCVPLLDDLTPYVEDRRILAVQAEPAEAVPGTAVSLRALVADQNGAIDDAPIVWGVCIAPRPLAELGPVAPECLDPTSDTWLPAGTGMETTAVTSSDACARFGPNPPPPIDDEPPGRPVDPDITGGFYQPATAALDDQLVLVSLRLRCGIANVAQETFIAWNQGYRSNENPASPMLTVNRDGQQRPLEPLEVVAPGEELTLGASWPDCPTTGVCGDGICSHDETSADCPDDCSTPRGCAGPETYLVYDPDLDELITRREAVSATWFTTGGILAEARNGRSGADGRTSVDNVWTAPEQVGEVWIAVAVRDERGGVAYASQRIDVRE
jgi:hypothetical protein